jgi:hypothetical protein
MEQIQAETKWKSLYRIAGFAAIAMLVIIPVQILVFVVTPIPVSIESWFSLFHNNWLLGLIHQDMLYIVSNILVAVMYLGLYIALRAKNESVMTVALLLGLLGIATYFASNKSFELLGISNQYYAASTETQQFMLLAAGQALLSGWQGTAFLIYYILNGITLVLISCVMLKSVIFKRTTAVIGLISGVLMMIPSTAGTIGLVFSLASLIPWYIFSILTARRLLQISR